MKKKQHHQQKKKTEKEKIEKTDKGQTMVHKAQIVLQLSTYDSRLFKKKGGTEADRGG